MLHPKKSILQIKTQNLRRSCRHVALFKPVLCRKCDKYSKTGARQALGPWVLMHGGAMCHQAHSQKSGAKLLSTLRLCVLRLLWANCTTQSCKCVFRGVFGGPPSQQQLSWVVWAPMVTTFQKARPTSWLAPCTKSPGTLILYTHKPLGSPHYHLPQERTSWQQNSG